MSTATDRATGIQPHTWIDDVFGIATGVFLTSFGLVLLDASNAVTGGTAGLGLLLAYATGIPFGILFLVVNLPFFVLAWFAKGRRFTLRSVLVVTLVSLTSSVHASAIRIEVDPLYGSIAGNLIAGVGLLVLIRHEASLGGYGIVGLVVQERWGWRAGYVQMALDLTTVLLAFSVVSPFNILCSAIGVVVLDLVLAVNHRPGRYIAR